ANPGCYATAMILGLLPFSSSHSLNSPVVIDAKSGTSGAGKSLKQSSLFCEVHDTFSAYSTGVHRHTAELIQETAFTNVLFSPHLLPIDRGIEAAIYISSSDYSESQLVDMYNSYYKNHPFVQVLPPTSQPNLNMVKNTNYCVIIPKAIDGWVVVFSLIDNLVKGASGQAIQNANIMFGFHETTGLI
ncbi:MAG: Asd/ArgC dimerization domain-containing protein, partial [Candidatus Margulisiibacteriota bacterium]|nr:Asd/ArgC dimerization domain-containing protein [Candidatus Margulisiibacteriota bacterium]